MRKSDWDDVKRIYCEALEEGKSTFQTTTPTYDEWNNNHSCECRYVATVEDRVAGWIAISPTSSRVVYHGVVEVSVYIGKSYRHNGIGKMLLMHLCEESEQKGYWCLYSSIFSINESSIQLHKNCGFRVIGYREKIAKDRFGTWQDTTLMERRNNIR